jgi:hypothetical protein
LSRIPADPNFREYIQGLNPVQLRREIEREQELQNNQRERHDDLLERRVELEQLIEEERLEEKVERLERRRDRIQELISSIDDINEDIEELRENIERYNRTITRLTEEIGRQNYYAATSRSPLDRMIWRESQQKLIYSRGAYRGHRTRNERLLQQYIQDRASLIGELGAQSKWLQKEAPLEQRLQAITREILYTQQQVNQLEADIRREEIRLEYKRGFLPEKELIRTMLNYYLIIEGGEHTYPRGRGYYVYRNTRGGIRRARHKVKYPKGRFQAWIECDCFIDPDTSGILQDEDPFSTLDGMMRGDVAREFMEYFNLANVHPEELTLGQVSQLGDPMDIGKPPKKLRVERTVEEGGGSGWHENVNEFIMTIQEYDAVTRHMTEYRQALRRLGEG